MILNKKKIERHELINNKIFVLYKDEFNNYSIFLESSKSILDYANEIDNVFIEKFSFFYKENDDFVILDGKNETPVKGESIIFKNKYKDNDDFFNIIFSAIYNNLISSNDTLIKIVEKISEFLSTEDIEISKALQGFVGEILFIYKLMTAKTLLDNKEIKLLYKSIHTKNNQKHDYNINNKLKIEIKSTHKENRHFKIKEAQHAIQDDVKLFYCLIKYDFTQPGIGKSFNEIVDEINNEIAIDFKKNEFLKYEFAIAKYKDLSIDIDNVEMYIINSNKLPNYWLIKSESTNSISEIQYNLDINSYYKYNKISNEEESKDLIEEIKNAN